MIAINFSDLPNPSSYLPPCLLTYILLCNYWLSLLDSLAGFSYWILLLIFLLILILDFHVGPAH